MNLDFAKVPDVVDGFRKAVIMLISVSSPAVRFTSLQSVFAAIGFRWLKQ